MTVPEGKAMLVDGMMASFNEGMTGEDEVDSDAAEEEEQERSTGIGVIKRPAGSSGSNSGSKRRKLQVEAEEEEEEEEEEEAEEAQVVKRPAMAESPEVDEALQEAKLEVQNANANKALQGALQQIQRKKCW